MTSKPCLTCGEPSAASRCEDHRRQHKTAQVGPAAARGYDAAWNRLSRRARKLSPFCAVCGATADLQTDHLPSAWERRAAGKPIRLADVRVLCRPCNVDAGSSRPGAADRESGAETHPGGPLGGAKRLWQKPQSPLHTGTVLTWRPGSAGDCA